MPTHEYKCPNDGAWDHHQPFSEDVLPSRHCPECGTPSVHVLRAPAGGIKVVRTWNDDANEMRRDPYTQARYQAEHTYNESRDSGMDVDKVTEAGLQAAAATIDAENKGPKKPSVEERAVRRGQQRMREAREEKHAKETA